MTAPTLAAITSTVTAAVDESLARVCYQGDDHANRTCECPTKAEQALIVNVAITEALQALGPFIDECLSYARMNDEVGDRRDADGNHGGAQRAYGSRDAHNSVAKQLRALVPTTTGEKS